MLKEKDIDFPAVIITDREKALMSAVEAVFPAADSLLSQWHQNKDVIAHCREYIGEQILDLEAGVNPNGQSKKFDHPDTKAFLDIYNKCINAETQEAFRSACQEAEQANMRCAEYLAREWWPWKEKCVAYWTNQVTHYGQQTTSGLEGTHALMKKWLANDRSDLCTSLRKLITSWRQLFTEVMYSTEAEETSIPYSLSGKIFSRTVRVLHRFPLLKTADLLVEARQRLSLIRDGKEERTICHNSFRTAHGRPCVHELMDIIESDGILSPRQYHRHWWIDKEKAPVHVRERVHRENAIPTPTVTQQGRLSTAVSAQPFVPVVQPQQQIYPREWYQQQHPSFEPSMQGSTSTQLPPSQPQHHQPQPEEPFFQARDPHRGWGYVQYTSFGTHPSEWPQPPHS